MNFLKKFATNIIKIKKSLNILVCLIIVFLEKLIVRITNLNNETMKLLTKELLNVAKFALENSNNNFAKALQCVLITPEKYIASDGYMLFMYDRKDEPDYENLEDFPKIMQCHKLSEKGVLIDASLLLQALEFNDDMIINGAAIVEHEKYVEIITATSKITTTIKFLKFDGTYVDHEKALKEFKVIKDKKNKPLEEFILDGELLKKAMECMNEGCEGYEYSEYQVKFFVPTEISQPLMLEKGNRKMLIMPCRQ